MQQLEEPWTPVAVETQSLSISSIMVMQPEGTWKMEAADFWHQKISCYI